MVGILVVEDSATQAEQIRHALERARYRVSVASNGEEAMIMLEHARPDLVISDIVMPKMDGYELCRRIRQEQGFADLPVILVTALSDARDVIRGLEAGATNFIRKPYEEGYLLSRVRQVIANRELRRHSAAEMGINIYFGGQEYFITSDRIQVLDLLLSTYEAAVQQNKELLETQDELRKLNEELESKVAERTHSLTIEIERRQEVETRLAEERNLLRTIIDAIPDAISVKDLNHRFVTGNAALLRGLHLRAEGEINGKTDSDFYPNTRAETERQRETQVLELSRGRYDREEMVTDENGKRTWRQETIVPLLDETGKTRGLVKVERDVTERRLLEDQVRHSQKMEVAGRIAAGIAHDFNNLLTVIFGFSDYLLAQAAMSPVLRSGLEQVRKASEKAALLTHRLLAFCRLEPVKPESVDLNALIRDIGSMLKGAVGEDVTVSPELDPQLDQITADRNQIEQVIMNLAVNARDAMPRGGTLTLRTTNARRDGGRGPSLIDGGNGRQVLLEIADTGLGMTDDVKSHLFEPFFTTKEAGRGTGLGLATVYGIVREAGGEIDVESAPSRGTSFRIWFPAAAETVP